MAKCDNPFILKETGVPFPCGKCLLCRNRRASGWSFRLRKQLEVSDCAFFVTLTYNTDYVPLSDKGYMTLQKNHCQKFIKRLRKAQQSNDIKYYLAGEYGDDRDRPHYHIILFNCQLSTLIGAHMAKIVMRTPEMYLDGKYHYDSKHWADPETGQPYGAISIGTVTMASIGYTLKYIQKQSKIPIHKNDDRKKEFSLISKGLGKSYLSENVKLWHHANLIERMYLPIEEQKKIAMPRYYKNQIYTNEERELIGIQLSDYEEKEYELLSQRERLQKYDKRVKEVAENNRKLYRTKPR